MATKQVMVTAPLMVLIYDAIFVSGSPIKALRRHGLFYLPLAATWGILAALQAQAPPNQTAGWDTGIYWWEYALTELEAITHYLRLTFWPDALCMEYGLTIRSHLREVFPQALLIGTLLVLTGIALWRRPAVGFPGVWFFLILAPTSSIMPLIDPIFEHRMYLSLAGPVALTVTGFYGLVKARRWQARTVTIVCTTALLIPAAALAWRTYDRNRDYYDHETIWRDVLAKRPQSQRAHAAIGVFLARDGKHEQAIEYFNQALKMNPTDAKSLYNLALSLEALGREDEAIEQLRKSIELRPDAAPCHAKLGLMLAARRRYEEALPHFREAVRLQPLHPGYRLNLGRGLMEMGRTDQAVETFKELLGLDPKCAQAYYQLGNIYAQQGQFRLAAGQFKLAIDCQEDFAAAHVGLAQALIELGQEQQAQEHLARALEIDPHHGEAHYRLGALLTRRGRFAEALEHFRQARPDAGQAGGLAMLGQLLTKQGDYSAALKYYRQALEIDPDSTIALNELAWLLATCPQEAFRDAGQAVALAERACELTEYHNANMLDTLSAAHAEAGRFDQAAETARKAIQLAQAENQDKLVEIFRQHLELYLTGKPVRQERAP